MARSLGGTAAVFLLAAVTACGGGGGPGGGGGGSGFTASVDGTAYTYDQFTRASVSAQLPGNYILIGSRIVSGTTAESITLSIYNISATGTYPLGVNSSNLGGFASILEGSTSFMTPLNGASGTVTVTTLTSTRIAGTFAFTAANPLSPTSVKTVTNGSFDLTITGTPGTVLPNQGSSMSAQIAGAAWNGATIVMINSTSGVFAFGAQSVGGYSLNFTLTSITGPGTYPLSTTGPGPSEALSAALGSTGWSSQFAGSTGSVVVTSLTNDRIKGTFSATLTSSASGSLTIAGGAFDLGIP